MQNRIHGASFQPSQPPQPIIPPRIAEKKPKWSQSGFEFSHRKTKPIELAHHNKVSLPVPRISKKMIQQIASHPKGNGWTHRESLAEMLSLLEINSHISASCVAAAKELGTTLKFHLVLEDLMENARDPNTDEKMVLEAALAHIKSNERSVFTCGTKTHGMLVEFRRNPDKTFAVTIFNSGDGLQEHDCAEINGKIKYRTGFRIHQVNADRITMNSFYNLIKHNGSGVYNIYKSARALTDYPLPSLNTTVHVALSLSITKQKLQLDNRVPELNRSLGWSRRASSAEDFARLRALYRQSPQEFLGTPVQELLEQYDQRSLHDADLPWQSRQKSGNCTTECIHAWLKARLGDRHYLEFRLAVLDLADEELSVQDYDHQNCSEKLLRSMAPCVPCIHPQPLLKERVDAMREQRQIKLEELRRREAAAAKPHP